MKKWSGSNILKITKLAVIFCLQGIAVYSQEKITGKVIDNDGLPLRGATVIIKGSALGTQTDSIGIFSINGTKGEQLLFSIVGYETREITLGDDPGSSVIINDLVNTDGSAAGTEVVIRIPVIQ